MQAAAILLAEHPLPCLLFDARERLTYFNHAASGLFTPLYDRMITGCTATQWFTRLAEVQLASTALDPPTVAAHWLDCLHVAPTRADAVFTDGRWFRVQFQRCTEGVLLCWTDVTDLKSSAPPPQDPTQRLRSAASADERLHAQYALLNATLEAVPEAMIAVDVDANLIACNHRYIELFQVDATRLHVGQNADFVEEEAVYLFKDFKRWARLGAEKARYPGQVVSDVLEFVDGRLFTVSVRALHVAGRYVGRVWSWLDITERLRLENELRMLATTDALTGVWNRRHFMERAEAELVRCYRYGRACALLMLDIDHFKHINDHHGHAAGDEALRRFATVIRTQLRSESALGRLGGEEFALLLPEALADEAVAVAERLRRCWATVVLDSDGQCFYSTVSIGVAVSPDSTTPLTELLRAADQALYRAKQLGRNRTAA